MIRVYLIAVCIASCLANPQSGYTAGSGATNDALYGSQTSNKDLSSKPGGETYEIVTFKITPESPKSPAPMQNSASDVATGMVHQVTVGGAAGLVYVPNTITAEIGDMVQFNFMSKNHTATQSSFASPCVQMVGGADSGFVPNPDNSLSPPPTFMYKVTSKEPTWWYCKQQGHCGKGMTFSINPTPDKTQAQFIQMAMQQNGAVPPPPGGAGNYASPPYAIPNAANTAIAGVAATGTAPAGSAALGTAPVALQTLSVNSPVSQPPPGNLIATATEISVATATTPSDQMAPGSGGSGSGSCECSCLCGIAAFPAGAGVGMWGGLPGAVPASW